LRRDVDVAVGLEVDLRGENLTVGDEPGDDKVGVEEIWRERSGRGPETMPS